MKTIMVKKINYFLIAMLACVLLATVGCRKDDSPPALLPSVDISSLDELRYNEVSFKQIHNCYHEDNNDTEWNFSQTIKCDIPKNMTIEEQLSFNVNSPWYGGVGGIEMDLQVDTKNLDEQEWNWCVRHRAIYSPEPEVQFSTYLDRLSAWSAAHPNHDVINVMLELKWIGYKTGGNKMDDCCVYWLPDCLPSDPPDEADYNKYKSWFRRKIRRISQQTLQQYTIVYTRRPHVSGIRK